MPSWNKTFFEIEDKSLFYKRVERLFEIKIQYLWQLVNAIARKHDLKTIAHKTLAERVYARGQTVNTLSTTGQMWIDRYFLAYQLDCNEVQYVYISSEHFHETMGDKRVAHTRCPAFDYGDDILGQMAMYREYRNYTRQPIWISDEILYDDTSDKNRWLAHARREDYDWRKAAVEQRKKLYETYNELYACGNAGGIDCDDQYTIGAMPDGDTGSMDGE